jgi:hypothetical protein
VNYLTGLLCNLAFPGGRRNDDAAAAPLASTRANPPASPSPAAPAYGVLQRAVISELFWMNPAPARAVPTPRFRHQNWRA